MMFMVWAILYWDSAKETERRSVKSGASFGNRSRRNRVIVKPQRDSFRRTIREKSAWFMEAGTARIRKLNGDAR